VFDRRRQQPASDYIKITQLGESQFVEFKRAAVEAKHLAEDLVALANADGGTVLIGVEDDGSISGIESYRDNVDELLRAPYIHCVPPVEARSDTFMVEDRTVLALDVAYSTQVHETTSKAVYLRVGRKNQRLGVNLFCAWRTPKARHPSKARESKMRVSKTWIRPWSRITVPGLALPAIRGRYCGGAIC